MPRWWVYIFWATIVFSVLYFLNVPGVGIGKGRIADYDRAMAAAAAVDAKRRAAEPAGASPEQLAAMTKDASVLALGKQTFGQNCAACHRADAGGQIGPNLTDDYWLHGDGLAQIHKTVADGVLEKGMPPWGKVLKPDAARRRGRIRVHASRNESAQPEGSPGRHGTAVSAPVAIGRVLPTLNEDGSRRWIRPKPSHGAYAKARRAVAYGLMLVFFLIPHVRMRGKPLILLDLPRRQFT